MKKLPLLILLSIGDSVQLVPEQLVPFPFPFVSLTLAFLPHSSSPDSIRIAIPTFENHTQMLVCPVFVSIHIFLAPKAVREDEEGEEEEKRNDC